MPLAARAPFALAVARIAGEHAAICLVSLVHCSLFKKQGAHTSGAARAPPPRRPRPPSHGHLPPSGRDAIGAARCAALRAADIPAPAPAPVAAALRAPVLDEAVEEIFRVPGVGRLRPLLNLVRAVKCALLADPDEVRRQS